MRIKTLVRSAADLRRRGEISLAARKQILEDHLAAMEKQIRELESTKDFVKEKIALYERAIAGADDS